MQRTSQPRFTVALALCAACSGTQSGADDDVSDDGGELEVPNHYAFDSRFAPGESGVVYAGQTFRQVLIASVEAELEAVQSEIEAGSAFEAGEVAARLRFYYAFDKEAPGTLDLAHGLVTTPAPLQTSWGDISGGASLQEKLAGNDADPQHEDWSTALIGWDASTSPEALVLELIDTLDALAVGYSGGAIPVDPTGAQIEKFYMGADGVNYHELLQKFLLGAVTYSQGTDDYLDDAHDNGLNSDNVEPDAGGPYTALEHAWDEGFGYWGGARDYLDYGDDAIAEEGYRDADGDGAIDLKSEFNFGASVNAAKRDRGSAEGVATDYSTATMTAFLTGRAIIAAADGALTGVQLDALKDQRDLAVDGWERALAATAVHYFNDTLKDMNAAEYSFADHATHWSELKGFLFMLQFNPRSQVSDDALRTIHGLIGMAPVFPEAVEAEQYRADLVAARGILVDAYAFDPANVGDDAGEGGW